MDEEYFILDLVEASEWRRRLRELGYTADDIERLQDEDNLAEILGFLRGPAEIKPKPLGQPKREERVMRCVL